MMDHDIMMDKKGNVYVGGGGLMDRACKVDGLEVSATLKNCCSGYTRATELEK